MKIKRQKQAKHILSMFKNTFKIHEPYQVLIDGTFAQAAHKNKVFIHDQLSKYLGSQVQCFTTKCVLAELDLLGSQMHGAKAIAQSFPKKYCTHKTPMPAYECLKSMIGESNESKYFIATQDSNLTKYARSVPGMPILYIYQMSILLDKPSKATNNFMRGLNQGKLKMSKDQLAVLSAMKEEAKIVVQQKNKRLGKRKRSKGPNPLSCKKKKKLK